MKPACSIFNDILTPPSVHIIITEWGVRCKRKMRNLSHFPKMAKKKGDGNLRLVGCDD